MSFCLNGCLCKVDNDALDAVCSPNINLHFSFKELKKGYYNTYNVISD